jgi:hypothetical protein
VERCLLGLVLLLVELVVLLHVAVWAADSQGPAPRGHLLLHESLLQGSRLLLRKGRGCVCIACRHPVAAAICLLLLLRVLLLLARMPDTHAIPLLLRLHAMHGIGPGRAGLHRQLLFIAQRCCRGSHCRRTLLLVLLLVGLVLLVMLLLLLVMLLLLHLILCKAREAGPT